MKISKDVSLSMRGMAILSICLHNFIHQDKYGFARENEMEFHLDRTRIFFEHIFEDSSLVTVFADIISFIGWTGVPVFVFLSGYGLMMKYKSQYNVWGKGQRKKYIYHSYLKLLLLLLPAAVFFILFRIGIGDIKRVFEILFSMTFLNSLFSGITVKLHYAAPPFWYFSLTFQLYLIFLLVTKVKNVKSLITLGGIFILLQMIVNPALVGQKPISYMRYNFIGWIPVFFSGILCAHKDGDLVCKKWVLTVLMLFSSVLVFCMNWNYYTWVIMPFLCILFFYSISELICSVKIIKAIPIWLGKISSYIFVCHPISLLLIEKIMKIGEGHNLIAPLFLYTVIYFLLTIGLVYLYKPLHQGLVRVIDKTVLNNKNV